MVFQTKKNNSTQDTIQISGDSTLPSPHLTFADNESDQAMYDKRLAGLDYLKRKSDARVKELEDENRALKKRILPDPSSSAV
jgi:hypothetical protein